MMIGPNKLHEVSRHPLILLGPNTHLSIALVMLRVMKHFSAIVTERVPRNLTFGGRPPLAILDDVYKDD
jgi:hypothetical protein